MSNKYQKGLLTNVKDYSIILFGLALYALGFTAFILPHDVIMGGLPGVGTLVLLATEKMFGVGNGIPVSVTQYICNIILLIIAFRIVGKTFVLRTVISTSILSLFIGMLEFYFRSNPPLISEISLSVALGGICCGTGMGMIFTHNGSTGGTDIVAAMVSKLSNVSIGRTIIYVDMMIILSSLLLPFDGTLQERVKYRVPIIVYGFIVTYVMAYVTDMVINTNRQAVQFFIFSNKWQEIADAVNREARRGVTILDGQGWYSKNNVKILMVWCRKIEAVTIHRIIKSVDEDAFITQTNTNGVYGKGFDTMKVKIKPRKNEELEN